MSDMEQTFTVTIDNSTRVSPGTAYDVLSNYFEDVNVIETTGDED